MELYAMIYQRLVEDETLEGLLAQYDNRPAVFYQHPATADDPKWGTQELDDGSEVTVQYPRIDYSVDTQENPARNTSGTLMLNVWCDAQFGSEPEAIEAQLRQLFHVAFAQTDDYAYCLAWLRSDAFEVKTKPEENARTFGVTVVFDLMACPSQITLYPDPIKGMNEWTKGILPDATVIGTDEIDGWLVPTRETPVIYWRIVAQEKVRQHFTHTWLGITIEGHVYCRNAADRLYNLIQLNTAHALADHIPLEDTSPLFLKTFTVQPHMNYVLTGQIRATGYFGILQPESHLSTGATGKKLVHVNLPREIIEEESEIGTDGDNSQGYRFPYEPAGTENAQTS